MVERSGICHAVKTIGPPRINFVVKYIIFIFTNSATPIKVKDFDKKDSRQISNELRKMLRQDDLERRIKEAEATIAELKPAIEKAKAGKRKK